MLASASPRRAQLLRDAGYTFRVVTPPLHEPDDFGPSVPPHARAEALSFFKARSVARGGTRGLILAADTVVALGGTVFGKPADMGDARRILKALLGTTHQVITGVTLLDTDSDQRVIMHCRTDVTMRRLASDRIEQYLMSGQWQGKAGAYGIQDRDDPFVESIAGSFSNVVGLPMETLAELLARWPSGSVTKAGTVVTS